MANPQSPATALHISKVFPWHYQLLFMVVEPGAIIFAMAALLADPTNHYRSLSPANPSGPFYTFSSSQPICGPLSAWNTPQLRALWYVLVAAFLFSGIVEPLVLYTARYKLRDARDAEEVVRAVLLAFLAFDVLHVGATLAVAGGEAAMLGPKGDFYVMINTYVPVGWMVLRSLWLLGVGRDGAPREKTA
ncbi:hypothetical protein LIA77_09881 [Sarocladium implicatum]|nr:hypothetical protein LIA77_09881 [Sarocladium implicatum]